MIVGDCNGTIISQYEPLFDSLLYDKKIIEDFDYWIDNMKCDFSEPQEYINNKIPNNIRVFLMKHKNLERKYNKPTMTYDSRLNFVSDHNSEIRRYLGIYTARSYSEKLTACYYICE